MKYRTKLILFIILIVFVFVINIYSFIILKAKADSKYKEKYQNRNTEKTFLYDSNQSNIYNTLNKADSLSKGYYFEEALNLLKNISINNNLIKNKINEIEKKKNQLERYNDKIYHIFFHSLIIYPELAFKSENSKGYNMWMTTKGEFNKILPLLLENNFILFNIEDIATIDVFGNVSKKDIYLPKGKKPLIISFDDVNYYDYMENCGFAKQLILNKSGDVVTLIKTPANKLIESYEGDAVPILDTFVKNHPEFSYRGAKGVIALTGYQGILGYRLNNLKGLELDKAKIQAKAVADRLKETGWKFANHSFSHSQTFNKGTITVQSLKNDIDSWEDMSNQILGSTPVFITPFGVSYGADDERFKYMISRGYYIICPVYKEMNTVFYKKCVIQSRLNFDGFTMQTMPERIKKYFFDPALVIDKNRPKIT